MAFCPFLSFKAKIGGIVYDELGAVVAEPGGIFAVGAVCVPSNSFLTDADSSDFDSNGFFVCPQSNRCQMWGDSDCGLKTPPTATPGPSPSTLLNEFLNKTDGDDLDLTPLGVIGSVYGFDFMIDDPSNIPSLLKAAHNHPDWDDSSLEDLIESGLCTVTVVTPGYDSTANWEYEISIIDGTNDLVSSGVTGGETMYIVINSQGAFAIDTVDDSTTISLDLGLADDEPITPGTYAFKIDPKRITWDEYTGLF